MSCSRIFGKPDPFENMKDVHDDLSATKDKLLKNLDPSASYWDLVNQLHDTQGAALKHMQGMTGNGKKPPEEPGK